MIQHMTKQFSSSYVNPTIETPLPSLVGCKTKRWRRLKDESFTWGTSGSCPNLNSTTLNHYWGLIEVKTLYLKIWSDTDFGDP